MRPILTLALPPLLVLSAAAQAATFTETKLLPSDGANGDVFGFSVGISGTTAIVGAASDNDYSGSAYLFDTATGMQFAKLTASDAAVDDFFGYSAAISGSTAIVGAPSDSDNGFSSGSAYLFDTTTGMQLAKLTASDAAELGRFGYSVAISGSTAIVGVDYPNNGAYLFNTTTGTQIAKLTASDGADYENFGNSVAISGSTAIVGARYDDENGEDSGAAYLFDTVTGTQIAKLTASDAAEDDEFGISVAISGSTAIVGAWKNNDNGEDSGAAYLFDTVTGTQIAKLTASDAAEDDRFGYSVAISGTTAIVGGEVSNGPAYLFDTTTGTQVAKLTASDGAADDWFGSSVGISGTTAIVGSYGDDDNGDYSGSAYLYTAAVPLPAGVWLLGSALGLIALGRRRRAA